MSSKIFTTVAAAALACSLGSIGAKASEIVSPPPPEVLFTITSQTVPTITFELLESPSPNVSVSGGFFEIDNVPVAANGLPAGVDDFVFYNLSQGGGLSDTTYFPDGGITSAQLYTGTEQAPTFVPGTYTGSYGIEADPLATITISATPLPSTWLMLVGGFIGLGFFAHRGTKNRSATIAAA